MTHHGSAGIEQHKLGGLLPQAMTVLGDVFVFWRAPALVFGRSNRSSKASVALRSLRESFFSAAHDLSAAAREQASNQTFRYLRTSADTSLLHVSAAPREPSPFSRAFGQSSAIRDVKLRKNP
jgi:hypothetical protein